MKPEERNDWEGAVDTLKESYGEPTPEEWEELEGINARLCAKNAFAESLFQREERAGEVLTGSDAAMTEFAMMMKQWEALAEDYERREAEEREAEEKAKQTSQEKADADDAS
jgi:hypothetical protein